MVVLVMNSKFESVQVNYPVAGHTKFGPDGMFGWLGPLLRKFDLYEIDDIVNCAKRGGVSRYAVEKLDPTKLLDHAAYISANVLTAVNGINARHGILVTKTEAGCKIQLRDYSTDQWTTFRRFDAPLPKFDAARIPLKELSAAKVKDLLKQEKYSPTGTLSYAHFESANANPLPARLNPTANTNDNANADAMQVEVAAPVLPTANIDRTIAKNYGIAYYVNTPLGSCPVYAVKLISGELKYWLHVPNQ